MLSVSADAATLQSGVLDSNRSIDWTNSGVPGGIPNRTTIFATLNAATYGNGTTDASAAIQGALNNCPANQVVYLPAGTYRLNSTVSFNYKNGVTLRGAGPGKTILRPENVGTAIITRQTGMSAERKIVGGSSKGSRTITVSDASNIQPGTMLDVYQANDPDFYWSRGGSTDRTGQYAMVTAVSGNTIQLQDPLVWNLLLNPRFRYSPYQGASWCGIEDLTISANSSYGGSMVQFWNAYACWMKNIETAWGNGNEHIFLFGCLRTEIRDSYLHDTYSTTDGYGIMSVKSSSMAYGRGGTTGIRIENNIFSGFWMSMVLETEVGGVIAYNYARNNRYAGWPNYQVPDFNVNHGEHGMMNLFEGNVSVGFQNDGYHGSSSHMTLYRNWFSGQHVDANRTGNIKTIDLTRFSYYHNVIGNVLGNSNWPRATNGRYEMSGQPNYTEQTVIYRLGYPNMGNNVYSLTNPPSNADAGGLDLKVASTLLRWGNFDFQSNAARWNANEIPSGASVPATHTLPASFYLAAKPLWWGNASWPAIGPDVPGLANKIPAQLRYEGVTVPPLDTTPPTGSLTAPAAGATVSGTVTVSANASDNVSVAGVQFRLDGNNLGPEDASAPFSIAWNTTTTPNGSHALTARVRDAAGNSITSAAVNVTVGNSAADTTPPSTPTGLTASAASSAQINLGWSASTDHVGVTGYRVYRGGTLIATVTGTTYQNATGLTANTAYSYTVSAVDAAGNQSLKSSAASATTLSSATTGGLTGLYFNNKDFTALMRTRTDATVNFNWGAGSPDLAIGVDTFSARWIGRVHAATSETYTFSVVGDDGVRLWVNNKLIVDKWIDQAPTEWSGSIALTANVKYNIRLDYYENTGGAVCKLLWSTPTRVKAAIPQSHLFAPSATSPTVAIESVSTGKAYVLRTVQVDMLMYIDRNFRITSLPSSLVGGILIRTANDDKNVNVANHLTFSVTGASTITVAHDSRATNRPTWLNDGTWTATGKVLGSGSRKYRLFSKVVTAGNVTLGGNQQGISLSRISNYVVIVQPVVTPTANG